MPILHNKPARPWTTRRRRTTIAGTSQLRDPSEHGNAIKDMNLDESMLYLYAQGIYKHKLKYKTKLCFQFVNGVCLHGQTCKYAHGKAELRTHAQNEERARHARDQYMQESGLTRALENQ